MYGPRPWRSDGPCLSVLVRAMLTQNTSNANAERGYRQLRRRFPTWRQVLDADVADVQRQIAVCGLARMRARRLQALLRRVRDEQGSLSLQSLAARPAADAYAYLTSFHGIGPKTAACTLLFALGAPLFPVDNGILRVLKRLRLIRDKARFEEASATVLRHSHPRQRYALHVLMFQHAKQRCRPKNPKCDECDLPPVCPQGRRRLRHRPPDPAPTEARRLRRVILSRFASAGLPKDEEGVVRGA